MTGVFARCCLQDLVQQHRFRGQHQLLQQQRGHGGLCSRSRRALERVRAAASRPEVDLWPGIRHFHRRYTHIITLLNSGVSQKCPALPTSKLSTILLFLLEGFSVFVVTSPSFVLNKQWSTSEMPVNCFVFWIFLLSFHAQANNWWELS